jgi:SWI/SNF-related matrix-associated actin-dependent regulator 1 of chromatin subfamily A
MGRFGYEAKGATNLDDLRQKISRYFLRRTKDQILTELPPKNRVDVPIKLEGEHKVNYDKVSSEFVKFLRENKGKRDREILKSLNAEKLVKINYLREIGAMGKLNAVRELIDSILESGEKVLVFCSFNEPLKVLRDEYPDSVLILGEVDVKDRGELVKKFQNDPKCRVFFGGFKSAGVGITLTAASNAIMIDHSWNPADMSQAEDRMHRLGQVADSVNIYQFIARGTIDEFMIKLLDRKQKIFDVVIDAEKVEREKAGTVDELIRMIEEGS